MRPPLRTASGEGDGAARVLGQWEIHAVDDARDAVADADRVEGPDGEGAAQARRLIDDQPYGSTRSDLGSGGGRPDQPVPPDEPAGSLTGLGLDEGDPARPGRSRRRRSPDPGRAASCRPNNDIAATVLLMGSFGLFTPRRFC